MQHPLPSSGPQNCAACVHEGIYEEGVSVLESSSVRGPEAEHPNELKTRRISFCSTRGGCPSAAGGARLSPAWTGCGQGLGSGGRLQAAHTGSLSPQVFPDNAARREVESLPAICPSDGCTWKGTLKEYEVGLPAHTPWCQVGLRDATAWICRISVKEAAGTSHVPA